MQRKIIRNNNKQNNLVKKQVKKVNSRKEKKINKINSNNKNNIVCKQDMVKIKINRMKWTMKKLSTKLF